MELNDVLKLVGLEGTEETTIDQVKEHLDGKYLNRETAHEDQGVQSKIIGKHFSRLRVGMQRSFGVDEDFLKDEKGELLDPVDGFLKISQKVTGEIDDIKKKANEGVDKRVLDLETKLEESQKSFRDVTGLNKELSTQLDDTKNNFASEISQFKVKSNLRDLQGGLSIVKDLPPALKRGIDTEVAEDYKWNLDEEEKLQVRGKDGSIIPSKLHASTPAEPLEVLTEIYERNNALIKNGAPNKDKERFEQKKEAGAIAPTIAKRKDVTGVNLSILLQSKK